jgi:hypothetical protein
MSGRSFADEDTHFEIVRSATPVDVDGYKLGEPTGEIRCSECGAAAGNVDEIPHAAECPQQRVRSRWWVAQSRAE